MTNSKDITFYSFALRPLITTNRYISLNMTVCYCGYGTVELHFPKEDAALCAMLSKNPRLLLHTHNVTAVVTGFLIDEDIAVFAKTAEWLMTKRAARAVTHKNVTSEEYARQIVSAAMGDFISLGEKIGLGKADTYSNSDIKTVYAAVQPILMSEGLGFRIVLDEIEGKLVFQVYKGTARNTVISESARTAQDTAYRAEYQSSVSGSGWYRQKITDKGSWSAATNSPLIYDNQPKNAYTCYRISATANRFNMTCTEGKYLYSDDSSGKWRIADIPPGSVWVYIDGGDSTTGIWRWETVLDEVMENSEAAAEIAAMTDRSEVDTTIRRLEYGTDYCLGDTLRVQLEVGDVKATVPKQISSVTIYRDTDQSGIKPTFTDVAAGN